MTSSGGTLFGPCEPWPVDETCCTFPDDATAELIEAKTLEATILLWAASGRRVGPCPVTIRPCLETCHGSGVSGPYKDLGGAWRNAWCGCPDHCSCTALCRVLLPGPATEVLEVQVDGITLSEDAYKILREDGAAWLIRTDGDCWPDCQDYTAACDEAGAFCVTYLRGLPLDQVATAAVSELACELVRACIPNCPCRLPRNVVQQTRQGTTLTFDTARAWLRVLPSVASFLDVYNPHGLDSSPVVWSPDVPATRQVT